MNTQSKQTVQVFITILIFVENLINNGLFIFIENIKNLLSIKEQNSLILFYEWVEENIESFHNLSVENLSIFDDLLRVLYENNNSLFDSYFNTFILDLVVYNLYLREVTSWCFQDKLKEFNMYFLKDYIKNTGYEELIENKLSALIEANKVTETIRVYEDE